MYLDDRTAVPALQSADPTANEVAAGDQRLRKRVPRMVWGGTAIAVVTLAFAGTIVTVVLTRVFR